MSSTPFTAKNRVKLPLSVLIVRPEPKISLPVEFRLYRPNVYRYIGRFPLDLRFLFSLLQFVLLFVWANTHDFQVFYTYKHLYFFYRLFKSSFFFILYVVFFWEGGALNQKCFTLKPFFTVSFLQSRILYGTVYLVLRLCDYKVSYKSIGFR